MTVDPSVKAPSTMLEKVLVPASSAKATAMTSLLPKIMPVITRAVATSSRPGRRTANPPGRVGVHDRRPGGPRREEDEHARGEEDLGQDEAGLGEPQR